VWIEYGRWDREDWSQEDIDKKICDILTDLNRDAGLGIIRGSHKDRKSMYGAFQFRREWYSHKGLIHTMVGGCPMRARCGCQCEAKVVKDAISVVLSIANAHSKEDHEEEHGIKYLSHKQKCLVAESVKIAPLQTGRQLMQNIESSPSKVIDRSLSNSVARMVRKERKSLTSVALEGVDVDNTLGSLAKLSEALWIVDAFQAHKQGECRRIQRPYLQTMARTRSTFTTWKYTRHSMSLFAALHVLLTNMQAPIFKCYL
jgi:hypothetical protein